MMKRLLPYLLLLALGATVCFAGIASDGVIESGEYDYGVVSLNSQGLLVTGGGAYRIEARGSSTLDVRNTSPLSSSGGITGILLVDTSELLYSGGETDLLSIGNDATAIISGGTINMIRSFQLVGNSPHITIECQTGWEWIYNSSSQIKGITGVWANGSTFDIDFIDKTDSGYDPVYMNLTIPEPTTLALLGLGGFLIRKRKR